MDCSRVAQSLDSLWFYSNILTCCRTEDSVPVPCLTDGDQLAPPPIHAKEGFLHRPITPLCVLNQENESQHLGVENLNLVPAGCHDEIGECSSGSADRRETEKREMKMRRKKKKKKKKNKLGMIGGRKEILGAVELGFGVKQVCGVLNEVLTCSAQQKTKLPPIDDDVVMKKHIKSWAYAVACSVKVN